MVSNAGWCLLQNQLLLPKLKIQDKKQLDRKHKSNIIHKDYLLFSMKRRISGYLNGYLPEFVGDAETSLSPYYTADNEGQMALLCITAKLIVIVAVKCYWHVTG